MYISFPRLRLLSFHHYVSLIFFFPFHSEGHHFRRISCLELLHCNYFSITCKLDDRLCKWFSHSHKKCNLTIFRTNGLWQRKRNIFSCFYCHILISIDIFYFSSRTIAAALASGLTLHYTLINAAPAFVLAALLAAGMIFFPQKTLIIFRAFGNLLQAFIILALAAAGVESTLGITVIPGMDPLAEQLETIAMIGITLAGAYPFVHVLSKLLAPVLNVIAKLMGVNGPSVTGMLACLANPLPMYDMIPLMDERGKVLAMAFCTCANAMIGDHFAFISIAYPEGTTATFIVKIVSGAVALLIAALSTKKGGKTH